MKSKCPYIVILPTLSLFCVFIFLPTNAVSQTGGIGVTVNNADCSTPVAGVQVIRYDANYTSLIDYKYTPNAIWASILATTYNWEAYYDYSGNIFDREFWASGTKAVTANQTTNYILCRNYPYIESVTFYDGSTNVIVNPSTQVDPGRTIRAEVKVRNKVSSSLSVKVRMILDRNKSTSYEYDRTSSSLTIGTNNSATYGFQFTSAVCNSAGTWYSAFSVITTLLNGNTPITDTRPWSQAFIVSQVYYIIDVSAGTGGSISPSSAQVPICGNQTFTISPNSCYQISNVVIDGSSVGSPSSYTFNNVTASHQISASFSRKAYVITASAGPNGAISPSGNLPVNCGSNQSFTITPKDAGYHVADVVVDASSVGSVTDYTFNNVTSNHSIAASFAINNPIPSVTSLSPSARTVGGSAFTLTVNGSGFVSGSVVRWNNSNRTTTFLTSTQLTASITSADIATAGTAAITVFNPSPGGGSSDPPSILTITTTQPVLSVEPDTQWVRRLADSTVFTVSNAGSGILSWNASVIEGNAWLRITSGSIGTDAGSINLSYDPNYSTSRRAGKVRVTASDATGSPQDVTIMQDDVTFVEQSNSEIPITYALSQNYPNPFNPTTTIEFSMPRQGHVVLSIFNSLGMTIDVLVNQHVSPGNYRAHWIPRNIPSGVYFYQLRAGDFTETKRLLLLK